MNLTGKSINFLGDSITEGCGVVNVAENRYDHVMAKKCGLKAVYNYGIGGTRIAHQSVASEMPRFDMNFCGRAYDLNPDADIIVVYGGTNDYGHGDAPFGTEEDKTPDTFCGAVDFLMNLLLEQYAGKTVVFMTPSRRTGDTKPSCEKKPNAEARPLKDYVELIKKKGQKYNIPVLDLYENLGVDPNCETDREKYTADGLHLNDEGHKVLADCLIQFLESLD